MKTAIPYYMIPALESSGVDIKEILYATHTDMDTDGSAADVYIAISMENLYVLYGKEKVVKTEGARRIVALYEPDRLEVFSLKELEEPGCDRLLTTGRLFAEKDSQAHVVLLFSLGFMTQAEKIIKVIKNIKEEKDPLFEINLEDDPFCPECGRRYSEPERKICAKCLDKAGITRRLLSFFKDYRKKVLIILAVMLCSTAFAIAVPYLGARMLIDEVLTVGGAYYGAILAIVLLIFLVRIINTALNMLYQYVLACTIPWLIFDIKLKIFEAMQRLSIGFYTSKRTGSLMNRVTEDANNLYWFFVDGLPYLAVNTLTLTGVITVLCILNFRLALIVIIVMPVSIFMFRLLWSIFKRFHHKHWVYDSQLNSMVSDSVNGARVIKAFAREDEESGRFAGTSNKLADVNTKAWNVGFTAFPLIYLFMFLGQVIITAYGGVMVIGGEITLGTLLTFTAFLTMLYSPLEFMSWVSNWWARCVDSAQRVFEIIDAKPDIEEPDEPAVITKLEGSIDINGVWFEYDPSIPVLKGMDLQVNAGEMMGLVGKTGSGKTTLANLIARLYDVTSGEILIDGVNVKQYPLKTLRENVGIVSQDIYLFIGSIADNIRYARPDASFEEVICAAKAASAHEFIMNMSDAYETRVGAGGEDLSGGERQRLSIARTIIQNPKILILDEATAAMDTETEAAIQESLNKLQSGRTTIAIAHRLSTLRDADKLAVINDGKVVETGTHAELLTKKGEYHKLYTIQLEGLKTINMDIV
ncbi:MAG: ABC transporter ATP-binding protein/permease [Oscillospiraceae bacterium]|nr:ABC transporter ATP-binding protein/permease [Oscillospiraceae bacterium]